MSSVVATARPPALNEAAGPSTSRLPRQTESGAYPIVRRYSAAGGGGCMAVGYRSLWVANFIDDTDWRIPIDE